ncbi:helix-hairpin-helix domain-containing protein [Prevotella sp.]|uniref:helix-hairpin-helix domain-containing protein n=1 Tax=Prevotella sp. TaxID=59823 RepID=UPI002F921BBD
MKHTFLFLLFLLVPLNIAAQETEDWEQYLEHIITLDDTESTSWEEVHQVLSEYARHPININEATEDDLRQLLFLNDRQLDEIMTYLGKYHGMRTMAELNMLRELDTDRKMLLSHMIYIGSMPEAEESLGQMVRKGKQEVIATAGIPLYERAGQADGRYLGGGLHHWIRYDFNAKNRIRWGLVGAQDAGEPFLKDKNAGGYDYYSFYLQLRHWGIIDNLVIGRYKLKAGSGLVINNGLGLGKTSMLAILNSATTLTAHSSKSEFNYLQGAAVTLRPLSSIQITPFVSYRKLDGTFYNDSSTLYNIAGSGYHRTANELRRKHNTGLTTAGLLFKYLSNGFHLGATVVYNHLNRRLKPMKTDSLGRYSESQLYRMWLPQGNDFLNMSLIYGYNRDNLSVNGETAYSNSQAWATINTATYSAGGNLSFTALYRLYSYRYYALQSLSYSDGGATQNESGLYVGADWRITKALTLASYIDLAYSPWPKYQALGSSRAWDYHVNLLYQHHNLTLQARYRYRNRQRDNDDKTELIAKQEHRGCMSIEYKKHNFIFRTKANLSYSRYLSNSLGYAIEQFIDYHASSLRLQGSINYFHTQDYDSRVYSYERSLLYMMSLPVLSGHGIRYYLMGQLPIHKLLFTVKIGTTNYFDRNHISSGTQRISRSSQTDVDVQLRYSF